MGSTATKEVREARRKAKEERKAKKKAANMESLQTDLAEDSDGSELSESGQGSQLGNREISVGSGATISSAGVSGWEEDMPEKRSTMIIREITPNVEVGEALKDVPLLSHLNKSEREKLGGALELRTFAQGEVIFHEGEPGDTFYIIKEGRATATQRETGKQAVISHLSTGDYFGEQSILTNTPRAATVTAETALVCYSLDKTRFKTLFKKNRLDVPFLQRPRVAVSAEASVFAGDSRFSELEVKQLGPLPVVQMSEQTRVLVLNAIHKSLLFRNLDDTHKLKCATVMYPLRVKAGEAVIREGEEGNSFYVIEEGEFDVFQRSKENGEDVRVDNHRAGGCFGDLALLYDAPRNATCVAVCDSTVRVLERVWFNRINKELGEAMLEQYCKMLGTVELLAPLTNAERKVIADSLELVTFEPKQRIFTQGETGDAMYIILRGEALVTVEKGDKVEELRRCVAGDSFGERSLISAEPRTTTVTALAYTEALRLQRTAVLNLLGSVQGALKKELTDVSHDQVSTWKPLNVRMEDLQVLGVLGRGSYGFVQLVQDKKGGAIYALKAVSKQRIVDTHQKAHIFDEKRLMTQMDHPFLIRLFATYKDRDRLYFLLEPSLGGELFPLLRKMRMFPVGQAKFYAAQIVLAFQYLHSKNFIYRDLKPENLLLDETGYLKITDFGFCKRVVHKTWTMCGTPEYLAPEIIASRGHGRGVDWWTLGIFIYEMLAGHTPFYLGGGEDHLKMYDRILKSKYKFPSHFDHDAKTLIRALLQTKPTERLGVTLGGAEAVKQSTWLSELDWQAILWRKVTAPMAVRAKDPRDPTLFKQGLQEKEVKPYVDDGTDWDRDF